MKSAVSACRRAGKAGPCRRAGGQALRADRLAAAFAGAVAAIGQPGKCRVDLGKTVSGLGDPRRDVLTLEGDRCSLGVVLVVDVGLPRRLDQLGELTFQPAQTLSCRGTLGGKPLSRTLRRDPRHGTNLWGRCLCVYASVRTPRSDGMDRTRAYSPRRHQTGPRRYPSSVPSPPQS